MYSEEINILPGQHTPFFMMSSYLDIKHEDTIIFVLVVDKYSEYKQRVNNFMLDLWSAWNFDGGITFSPPDTQSNG